MKYLCILLLLIAPLFAQINIPDINAFNGASGGPNCTGIHQQVPDPGWEWNCDEGTPNCTSAKGHICANSPNVLVTNPSLDGKSREMDVTWSCPSGINCNATGGAIFHAGINGTGNLDTKDASFSWGGHFFYTDLTNINQLEFDLNQVMTGSDVMIYAAQCDFTKNGGTWEFSNGWGLTSNIPCPKVTWSTNTWHHVVISAHRCVNFVSGKPCNITYDSVAFDEVVTPCTMNCTANGRDGLSWAPVGLLLENVQLNPGFTSAGSMKVYADEMVTVSPESTVQPQLKCDSLVGPLSLNGNIATITNPIGTNCTLK